MDPRKKFLLKFALFLVAFYAFVAAPPVNDHAVVPFTMKIASVTGATLRAIGEPVTVDGTLVKGGVAAVNIENGCNGLEAAILLAAAVLAFPAPWRSRVLALVVGFVGIQALNLIRTTTLFLALKYRPRWFEALHSGVWQSVIVIAAVGFFLLWSTRQRAADSAKQAG